MNGTAAFNRQIGNGCRVADTQMDRPAAFHDTGGNGLNLIVAAIQLSRVIGRNMHIAVNDTAVDLIAFNCGKPIQNSSGQHYSLTEIVIFFCNNFASVGNDQIGWSTRKFWT